VKEVYAEIGVPVLQDSSLGRALDLNFAGRLTDYSTSGSVITWKAGARYEPIDGLEFRATRSRDIRAPNLQELFLAGEVRTSNVIDPFNGNSNANFLQTTRGNPDLDPEKADTLTAGVVFRPTFLPGASVSVDYYDIKIDDAIATNSSQFIVNRCFAGDQQFCSAITRNAANVITGINLQPFNALSERARGVDIELAYRTNLGSGDLTLRGLANYVDKLEIISPLSTIDRAGEVGNNSGAAEGVPSWRALASATYELDSTTFQLKGRFIGASKLERDWGPADININDVPAIFYLDVYLAQKVDGIAGSEGEFFLAADNVLNQDPPIVSPQDNSNLLSSGTNVFIYDTIGTTLRAGFRFNF
jgi:iron complex outermembrane recepter protein